MRVEIIKIGNSRGIRIPKAVLEELGLTDSADLKIENGRLVLERPAEARHGWEEAFASMAAEGDDEVILPGHSLTDFDHEDWDW